MIWTLSAITAGVVIGAWARGAFERHVLRQQRILKVTRALRTGHKSTAEIYAAICAPEPAVPTWVEALLLDMERDGVVLGNAAGSPPEARWQLLL